MGRRISKSVIKAYSKGWLRPVAILVAGVINKPKSITRPRPLFSYNPSIGKLRAWAEPLQGIKRNDRGVIIYGVFFS